MSTQRQRAKEELRDRLSNALAHIKMVALPEPAPDDYHTDRWEVPLLNPDTGEIGVPSSVYVGEVWVGTHPGTDKYHKIVTSGVSNPLKNAHDVRAYAVALLAAADRLDELTKEPS